jgi:tagaturonate epimerase
LLHVSFKIAAKMGDRYLNALKKHEAVVAKNVTENLFERHMKPLLLGK